MDTGGDAFWEQNDSCFGETWNGTVRKLDQRAQSKLVKFPWILMDFKESKAIAW